MIQSEKGDVVLVSFPYADETGTMQVKRRPAVVVSNNDRNSRSEDLVLVPLTRHTSRPTSQQQILVAAASDEGRKAGLRADSVIDCSIVSTIPHILIVTKIGRFSDETMRRVEKCIRRGIDPDGGEAAPVPRKPFPPHDESGAALDEPHDEEDKPQ